MSVRVVSACGTVTGEEIEVEVVREDEADPGGAGALGRGAATAGRRTGSPAGGAAGPGSSPSRICAPCTSSCAP